jgi:hypothetical protein
MLLDDLKRKWDEPPWFPSQSRPRRPYLGEHLEKMIRDGDLVPIDHEERKSNQARRYDPFLDGSELLDDIAAHHESGHVIAARLYGRDVSRVWVKRNGFGGGFTEFGTLPPSPDVQDVLEHAVIVASGRAAQEKFGAKQEIYIAACAGDDNQIQQIVERLMPVAHRSRCLDAIRNEARQLVEAKWGHIREFARVLLARGSLDAADIRNLTHRVRSADSQHIYTDRVDGWLVPPKQRPASTSGSGRVAKLEGGGGFIALAGKELDYRGCFPTREAALRALA